MNPLRFEEAVEQMCTQDNRFDPEAYRFVREALDFSIRLFEKPRTGEGRHVSGQELLEGIRQYALSEYGPLAYRVLSTWGITRTEDFGDLVFHLVDLGVLGQTENDRREDFARGYDFDRAFRDPFRPAPNLPSTARPGAAPEQAPPKNGTKKGDTSP